MQLTINVWFYTVNEKLCRYEHFFGKKYKNWDKMIQSGTAGEHTKNRDCSGKIETVGMFAKTSNSKHDWNPVKYLNVFASQTQKQLRYFFLIYCKNLTNLHFWVLWTCLAFIKN